jgi:D-arabinose 1-dehydrogenase-like Zn-dependent alcohol dehydrogenase
LSTTNSARQIVSAFGGLRPGGRFINMGVADGPIAIDPMTLMFGQRQIRGSSQDERSDLFEALQLVAKGKVKPMVETYPLARVNDVRERLEAGKVRYRAVLQHAAG